MTAPAPASPFTVLVVCTGNICRSPAAELLLRKRLSGAVGVTSAGTDARAGEGVAAPMATLLRTAGTDPEGFVARQLTEDDVRTADLVITMTRKHRSRALGLHPGALRRAVTLRELGRAAVSAAASDLPDGEAARLQRLVQIALRDRGPAQVPAELDEVPDPYRRSDAAYREALALIDDAVRQIATTVRG